MTQDEINKAFEGRWRIKGVFGEVNAARATMSFDEFYDYFKDKCRDFFEAGILLSKKATVPEVFPSGKEENEMFVTWWELYDKMVGRKDCEKKWQKLTIKEKEACIAAAPAYVASTPDKRFRKNPLSYLNQKAWNDEIIPRNNGNSQPSLEQQRLDRLASILTD